MPSELKKLQNFIDEKGVSKKVEKDPKLRSLRRVEDIFQIINDGITKEEFLKSFKAITDLVLRTQTQLVEKNTIAQNEFKERAEDILVELQNTGETNIQKLKNKALDLVKSAFVRNDVNKKLSALSLEHSIQINETKTLLTQLNELEARLLTMTDGEDGKDADEEKIIDDVLAKIVLPEQKEMILDGPDEIRNKLELLQGDERLTVKAISGLEELLKDMKGKMGSAIGPSVITPRPLMSITPTGSINSSNTTFTLPKAPKKDHLMLYHNGVRLRSGSSNDYTIAGKTITMLTAPLTGDTLVADIFF